MHLQKPTEVAFPLIERGDRPFHWFEKPTITRIKANAHDSAAFDEKEGNFYTWGRFGRLRLEPKGIESVIPSLVPRHGVLAIMESLDTKKVYATPPDHPNLPGQGLRLHKIDEISTVRAIDWGEQHCCFVDNKNRVFSLG